MNVTASQIDRLLRDRLTPARTLGLVALGCLGLAGFVPLTMMVFTEPEPLPSDTRVALLLVALAGLAWAVYAGWRLARRHVMLLADRLIAAALALLFSTVAVVGGAMIAFGRDRPTAGLTVLVIGTIVVGAAASLFGQQLTRYRAARTRLAAIEKG